jgi:hypothetical protein
VYFLYGIQFFVIALLKAASNVENSLPYATLLLVQNADEQTSWKTHEEAENEVSLSLNAALLELCVTTQ